MLTSSWGHHHDSYSDTPVGFEPEFKFTDYENGITTAEQNVPLLGSGSSRRWLVRGFLVHGVNTFHKSNYLRVLRTKAQAIDIDVPVGLSSAEVLAWTIATIKLIGE